MLPWWQDRATVTTMVGAVLAVSLGVVDAGWVHLFSREVDAAAIGIAIGGLLGHNPFVGPPAPAP